MTEDKELGLQPIRRALISVSDKTGIVDFAHGLKTFGVEIISTGGTAKALRDAGIDVRDVSDVTGFPEMMDGRVKTLHPKIHGGLLGVRDNPEHQAAMQQQDIEPIDMVVVNLYPFQETIAREDVTLEEAIEQIDIGGPAMIRSAAKNFRDVAVVVSPADYDSIISELVRLGGALQLDMREELAASAFLRTSAYDSAVYEFFNARQAQMFVREKYPAAKDQDIQNSSSSSGLPEVINQYFYKITDLRYGENPHQAAALYDTGGGAVASAVLLSGKEMSFNNYVDAEAAWQLVSDLDAPACAIIKHTNPAGAARGGTVVEAYRRALETDPISAFGGIVAFNSSVDQTAARAVVEIFTEVIIAPQFDEPALEVLRSKKNLRVLRADTSYRTPNFEYKQISGGMLAQTRDTHELKREDLKVVTKRAPTEKEIEDLLFAWIVCKHTKSNAIVYVRDKQTVGVGAGQMSRVDSVKLGAMRAQLPVAGSVLASDAFFPFRDGLDEAAKHGITAVIEPGGSMRDAEVIAAADEHGLAMVFTGFRHFKH
ncbi:MAG TPA: bifunctional phosphoribosylaminoimidazolecarboxamide formyltransferase/IMP cyclohydrolase [Pyrinomonadaceae bacterium]|jgi:phosphoribosylaminoimidazolecarboxamide formyltransferase/IMP cyclohydrolase|nr:bifunctional phosphoribosylaminoimidazolecarboxamide formyltransferase/IMP cyclohydrolase [Pyrinomonadaceae bacterium]